MRKRAMMAVVASILGFSGTARAALPADLGTDLRQLGLFYSERVGEGLAFNAASSPLGNADTLKLLGVELGFTLHGSAMQVDDGDFRALPLITIDNQGSQVEVPENIGVPGGVLHARVGLPGGFDIGAKAGGYNFEEDEGDATFDFENNVYGVEVRKRLMGGSGASGAALPDLSLSLAYDRATGKLDTSDRYSGPLKGGQTLDAAITGKTDWNVGAFTARFLVSKTVLIFTPYAGLGYTKHTGEARSNLNVAGTLSGTGAVNETGTAESDVDDAYGSILLGGEVAFFPMFRVNLGLLLAKEKAALGLGANLRFR